MKSSKVVAKSKTINEAKRLSMITFVAFCFATSLAHADVTKPSLWHDPVGSGGNASELTLLDSKAQENEKAVRWLTKEANKDAYIKVVQKFQEEPLKMVEAFKLSLDQAKKDNKVEEFKKKTMEGLFSDSATRLWKGKAKVQSAYKALFTELLEMETIGDNYLEELFKNRGLFADLNITDKEPGKKEEEPKPTTGEKSPESTDFDKLAKPFCDTLKSRTEQQIKGITDKFEQMIAALQKGKGEEDKKAQEEAAKKQKAVDDLNARLDQAELARAQALEAQGQNKGKEKDFNDLISPFLASLNDKNRDEVVTPTNNSTPFLPQTASNRRDNDTEENPEIPEVPVQQQGSGLPFGLFNPFGSNTVTTPAKVELPSFSANQEIAGLDQAASEAKKYARTADSIIANVATTGGAQMNLGQAAVTKGMLNASIENSEVRLTAAKDKLRKMDQSLEELKEGARSALSAEDKAKLQSLQADLESKKSQLQQAMQTSQMLSQFGDQTQGQQIGSNIIFLQSQVAQAEQAYNRQKLSVDAAVEQANGQIRSMKVQRDNLQASVTGLESQISQAQQKVTGLDTIIAQANAQAMAGAGQQALPNINNIGRIQGAAAGTAGPRTTAPLRGSLGSQK